MKVLIIGSGGREHALAWRLKRSPRVRQIITCPGNGGTARLGDTWPDLDPEQQPDALLKRIRTQAIDLVVIGPEAPLVAGLADRLRAAGVSAFGPGAAASRLEGSKTFAKHFLDRHSIPTARFQVVQDPAQLDAALEHFSGPLVVKADGLAAGKGVTLCDDRQQAEPVARAMLTGKSFGAAGRWVVLEERLEGIEQTMLVFVSGQRYRLLEPAQDYKPLLDGNRGPMTGGMGSFSPTRIITRELERRVIREILEPTLAGLAAEQIEYRGLLYLGLMLTNAGPQVLEFNVRFGDPETQPLMMRLSTDLVDILEALEGQALEQLQMEWDPRAAVCVVQASAGYPAAPTTGVPIHGPACTETDSDVQVFHAGTRWSGDQLVTSGGRVLAITALGDDQSTARRRAYEHARKVTFEGCQMREDIARGDAP